MPVCSSLPTRRLLRSAPAPTRVAVRLLPRVPASAWRPGRLLPRVPAPARVGGRDVRPGAALVVVASTLLAACSLAACSLVAPARPSSPASPPGRGTDRPVVSVTTSSLARHGASPPAPLSAPSAFSPPSTPLPVQSALSPQELGRARAAAEGFMAGYLPWLYGRAGTAQLHDLTAGLAAQLSAGRATVTPAEQATAARLVSLQVTGPEPGEALALAYIDDGQGAGSALAFQLVLRGGAWLVDRLFPG